MCLVRLSKCLEISDNNFLKTNLEIIFFLTKNIFESSLYEINKLNIRLNNLFPLSYLLKNRIINFFIFYLNFNFENLNNSLMIVKNIRKNIFFSNLYTLHSKNLTLLSSFFFKKKSNFNI